MNADNSKNISDSERSVVARSDTKPTSQYTAKLRAVKRSEDRTFRAGRAECMDAEFRPVRFTLKQLMYCVDESSSRLTLHKCIFMSPMVYHQYHEHLL